MTVGEKIQALRHSQGWTQDELTDRLNRYTKGYKVTRDMLANWETDRNEFPWVVARALVKVFKISLDQLILESPSVPFKKSKSV